MDCGKALVTGASTGIGEATAKHLKDLGFDVIAGVRKDADAERMREAGVETAILDVTESESIGRVRDELGDTPLAGLVNNAGIAISGPIEFVPIEELRVQLEVNLIGQVAVTQALLPSLRRGRGRIVNVSSVGGRVALPLAGPYAASKFALEAVSDSLRRELAPQGVDVVVVEPGGVKTPIWKKGIAKADELSDAMPSDADALYGELRRTITAESQRIATEAGLAPGTIAEVIGKALTARSPRARYLIGRDARLRARAARLLPDRVMDRMIARALSSSG